MVSMVVRYLISFIGNIIVLSHTPVRLSMLMLVLGESQAVVVVAGMKPVPGVGERVAGMLFKPACMLS
jgi:hypothetical protein